MTDIAELAFRVDTSDIAKADKALDGMDKTNSKAAGSLGKIASAVALVGFGALATQAVSMSNAFESSLNNVQSKLQISGEAMEALRDQAMDLGATTAFSASQAADGMGFLAQAGLDAEEIMSAMPHTLNLASAAQMDLATSADIATNVMGSLGKEVDDLPAIVDMLAATSAKANTNVESMAQAIKQAGPIANGFGVDMYDVSAAIGQLANNGFKGEQAGMILKNMFISLANPVGDGAKAMKEMNLKTSDFYETMGDGSLKFKGFETLFEELGAKGVGTTEILRIFGREAGPGMETLLAGGIGALTDLAGEVSEVGFAAKAAELQMQGLPGVIKTLKSVWETFNLTLMSVGGNTMVISLLKGATDILRTMTTAVKDAEAWFDRFSDRLSGTGSMAAAQARSYGFIYEVIRDIKSVLAPLIPFIDDFALALIGVGATAAVITGLSLAFGVLMSPIALAAAAIAGLAVAANQIRLNWEPAMRWFTRSWDEVKQTASDFVAWWKGTTFGDKVLDVDLALLDIAATTSERFFEWWDRSTLKRHAPEIIVDGVDRARELSKTFFNWWNSNDLETRIADVKTTLIDAARDVGTRFVNWWNSVPLDERELAIDTASTKIARTVVQGFASFWNDNPFVPQALKIDTASVDKAESVVANFISTTSKGFGRLIDELVRSDIGGVINDMWDGVVETAGQVWDDVVEGVSYAFDDIGELVEEVKLTFSSMFKGEGGIGKIFSDGWDLIVSTVDVAWTLIKASIKAGWDLAVGFIKTGLQLLRGDFKGAWKTITDTVNEFGDNLIAGFKALWPKLKTAGTDLVESVKSGFMGKLTSWIPFLKDEAEKTGKAIPDGIGVGILKSDAPEEAMNEVSDVIEKTFKGGMIIRSPSRLMIPLGVNVTEGVGIGIREGMGVVVDSISYVVDSIVSEFDALENSNIQADVFAASFDDISIGAEKATVSIRKYTAGFDGLLSEMDRIAIASTNEIKSWGELSKVQEDVASEMSTLIRANKLLTIELEEGEEAAKLYDLTSGGFNETLADNAIVLGTNIQKNRELIDARNKAKDAIEAQSIAQHLQNIEVTQGADAAEYARLRIAKYTDEQAKNAIETANNMKFQKEFYDTLKDSIMNADSVKDVFKDVGNFMKNWLKEKIATFAANKIMVYMGFGDSGAVGGLSSLFSSAGGSAKGLAGTLQGLIGKFTGADSGAKSAAQSVGVLASSANGAKDILGGMGGTIKGTGESFGVLKADVNAAGAAAEGAGASFADTALPIAAMVVGANAVSDKMMEMAGVTNSTAATIGKLVAGFGPVGAGIAKAFGGAWEQVNQGFDLAFKDGALSGNARVYMEKERSMFRGTASRVIYSELDAGISTAVMSFFRDLGNSTIEMAAKLGIDGAAGIMNSFEIASTEFKGTAEEIGEQMAAYYENASRKAYLTLYNRLGPELQDAVFGSVDMAKAPLELLGTTFAELAVVIDQFIPAMEAVGVSFGDSTDEIQTNGYNMSRSFAAAGVDMNVLTEMVGRFGPANAEASAAIEKATDSVLDWNKTMGLGVDAYGQADAKFGAMVGSLDRLSASGSQATDIINRYGGANNLNVAGLRQLAEQYDRTTNSGARMYNLVTIIADAYESTGSRIAKATENVTGYRASLDETTVSGALAVKQWDAFTTVVDSTTGAVGLNLVAIDTYRQTLDLNTVAGREANDSLNELVGAFGMADDSIITTSQGAWDLLQALDPFADNYAEQVAMLTGVYESLVILEQEQQRQIDTFHVVADTMAMLNLEFDKTSPSAIGASNALVELMGGLESFEAATNAYYESYYTLEERQANSLRVSTGALDLFNKELVAGGMSAVTTKEGLRELVDGLDRETEAGRQLFASAMDVAGVLDALDAEYKRQAESFDLVATTMTSLGLAFDRSNPAALKMSDNLVQLMGGMDAFSQKTSSYYDLYYDENEKTQLSLMSSAASVKTFNDDVVAAGGSAITSKEQFRAYVDSIDRTTVAGQLAFASAMEVAVAMDAVAGSGKTMEQIIGEMPAELQGTWSQMLTDAETASDALSARSGTIYSTIEGVGQSIGLMEIMFIQANGTIQDSVDGIEGDIYKLGETFYALSTDASGASTVIAMSTEDMNAAVSGSLTTMNETVDGSMTTMNETVGGSMDSMNGSVAEQMQTYLGTIGVTMTGMNDETALQMANTLKTWDSSMTDFVTNTGAGGTATVDAFATALGSIVSNTSATGVELIGEVDATFTQILADAGIVKAELPAELQAGYAVMVGNAVAVADGIAAATGNMAATAANDASYMLSHWDASIREFVTTSELGGADLVASFTTTLTSIVNNSSASGAELVTEIDTAFTQILADAGIVKADLPAELQNGYAAMLIDAVKTAESMSAATDGMATTAENSSVNLLAVWDTSMRDFVTTSGNGGTEMANNFATTFASILTNSSASGAALVQEVDSAFTKMLADAGIVRANLPPALRAGFDQMVLDAARAADGVKGASRIAASGYDITRNAMASLAGPAQSASGSVSGFGYAMLAAGRAAATATREAVASSNAAKIAYRNAEIAAGRVATMAGYEQAAARDGSYATGLGYVPFDGFRPELHKGEMILPTNVADWLRSAGVGGMAANNGATVSTITPTQPSVRAQNDGSVEELRAIRAELAELRREQSNASQQARDVLSSIAGGTQEQIGVLQEVERSNDRISRKLNGPVAA